MKADVLDYVGFGTMQLRFTIFTKLFHSVQFALLWSFLRKLLRRSLTATNKSKTEPFWLCFTHGLRLFPHNQASGFLNGLCPGERTDRAGLCKAHKARLCELERNPRQPTTNPLPQAEKKPKPASSKGDRRSALS